MSVRRWIGRASRTRARVHADGQLISGAFHLHRLAAALRGEYGILAGILIVAAGVRVAWVFLMPVTPESDFATFYQMAQLIATGHWQPSAYGWLFSGPGYPLLLAPLLAVGDDGPWSIRVVNVVLQLGTVACIWLLARRVFGRTAGLLAAAIGATLPGLWLYTPLVASENLAMLLLTAVPLLLLYPSSRWTVMLAGALAVALAFARPAFLLFPIVMAAGALWNGMDRPALQRIGWYVLGAALIFSPIAFANHSGGGPMLPISNVGYQSWLVHNERATGEWFPWETEDYPFLDLVDPTTDAAAISKAQQKLAFQFVVANPQSAFTGAIQRHRIRWETDRMGLYWTADRAPPEWRERIPLLHLWPDIANRYYLAVLTLAAVAAIRIPRRPQVLLPVAIPLIYVLLIYLPAEGNERYHVVTLPLLSVLAGSTLVPMRLLRLIIVGLAIALAWWLALYVAVGAWLIAIAASALAIQLIVMWLAVLKPRLVLSGQQKLRLALVTIAVLTSVSVLTWAALKRTTDQVLAELAAVDPHGWQAYQAAPGARAEPASLVLQPSNGRPGLRKVSYPDSALLRFEGGPAPGEVAGLLRTLPGLTPGRTYRFYVQLFDPRSENEPRETLTVRINDRIVWQQQPGEAQAAGWRYISIPWTADYIQAMIRIERRADEGASGDPGPAVLVRTLHLYPKY